MAAAIALFLVFGCWVTPAFSTPPVYDLVIVGGTVMDPESGMVAKVTVGVENGVIAYLDEARVPGDRVIDASGLVVAPGFIDVHTHVDGDLTAAKYMALMGVTSLIGGNCGSGPYPVGEFLDEMDKRGFPVNIGVLVGHNTLRRQVGVSDNYTAASGEQVARMKELAAAALREGAMGISFGLEYTPGASREEVLALAEVAGSFHLPIAAHVRFGTFIPPDTCVEAIREIVEAGRRGGAPVQISHIGSMAANIMAESLAVIEEARREGLDVTADCYPYTAWATSIGSAVFDPGWQERFAIDYSDVEVLSGPYAGQRLTPALFEELRREARRPGGRDTSVAAHAIPYEDVVMALQKPYVMVGSDGAIREDPVTGNLVGHPRGAGTFARVLGEFVRDKGVLPLMDALAKMTSMPARKFGLAGKGRIAVGADADLVVFDPEKVADRARFGPNVCATPPAGISYVIVNGTVVVAEGVFQEGARPGRALRPGKRVAHDEAGRLLPPPAYTPPAPGEARLAAEIDGGRMRELVRKLVGFGNRFGGSKSNRAAAAWLSQELQSYGLQVEVVEDPPTRTYDLISHEFRVVSPEPLPLKSVWPYAFSADAQGSWSLVYVPDLKDPGALASARGKALLAEIPKFDEETRNRLVEGGVALVLNMYRPADTIDPDAAYLLRLTPDFPIPVVGISFNEGTKLRELLARGEVVISGHLDQEIYEGSPVTVLATLGGSDPARYFLVCAHADGDSGGPSADDNTSSLAVMLEVARVLKKAVDQGTWRPHFAVKFAFLGKEYHSSEAFVASRPADLPRLLGVLNLDEVGTGASRDAILFESPDVAHNEFLLRTLDSVGRDYLGKEGFWAEYNTDPSLGGTDSYVFLPEGTARGEARGKHGLLIPATTVFTAAWYSPDEVDQVPFWPNAGHPYGKPVVVDYSAVYHSSADVPEKTTEVEPWNLVHAARAILLGLVRMDHYLAGNRVFPDTVPGFPVAEAPGRRVAGPEPNLVYAENLSRLGLFRGYPDGTARLDQPITWAEALAVVGRLVAYRDGEKSLEGGVEGPWYRPFVEKAVALGIISRPTAVDPAQPLTRLDLVKILARARGARVAEAELKCLDVDEIPLADRPYVRLALAEGWVEPAYAEDGERFLPADPVSRGEFLKRAYWVLYWEPVFRPD